LVGIYTQKHEIIGLGESVLSFEDFDKQKKGISIKIKRIVMRPNTYPKFWHSSIQTSESTIENNYEDTLSN
jgi:H/ACA ribonucleoprotein complex subunit 4